MTVNTNGGGVPLLSAERWWVCPNCPQTAVTREAAPHTRYHTCSRGPAAGMTMPMVPAGTRCKIEAAERQDYVGRELVQVNAEGRPVMSVTITRDDGQDCAVYAPCATARAEDS